MTEEEIIELLKLYRNDEKKISKETIEKAFQEALGENLWDGNNFYKLTKIMENISNKRENQ